MPNCPLCAFAPTFLFPPNGNALRAIRKRGNKNISSIYASLIVFLRFLFPCSRIYMGTRNRLKSRLHSDDFCHFPVYFSLCCCWSPFSSQFANDMGSDLRSGFLSKPILMRHSGCLASLMIFTLTIPLLHPEVGLARLFLLCPCALSRFVRDSKG
jgi:hypothetical protein